LVLRGLDQFAHSIDFMNATSTQPSLRMQSSLFIWENEGGASAIQVVADPDAQIDPAPSITLHSRTLGVVAQMVRAIKRGRHFPGWTEGEALL
jgi:hypothetical protein